MFCINENDALTRLNSHFVTWNFFQHKKNTKETICKSFRFFLSLSMKQAHAFSFNRNYALKGFNLLFVISDFLWNIKYTNQTICRVFRIFLDLSFLQIWPIPLLQKSALIFQSHFSLYYLADMRETLCENFRFWLSPSMKQMHTFSFYQN